MKNTDLARAGVNQGDMQPHVEDYSMNPKDFSQEGFSRTLDYIERQDAFVARESADIKRQSYKGRYN